MISKKYFVGILIFISIISIYSVTAFNMPFFSEEESQKDVIVNVTKLEPKEDTIFKADAFLKTFLSEEDFNKKIEFQDEVLFDYNDGTVKNFLIYDYKITYLRDNGKKVTSQYRLMVEFESGEIINEGEVRNRYNYLRERGI